MLRSIFEGTITSLKSCVSKSSPMWNPIVIDDDDEDDTNEYQVPPESPSQIYKNNNNNSGSEGHQSSKRQRRQGDNTAAVNHSKKKGTNNVQGAADSDKTEEEDNDDSTGSFVSTTENAATGIPSSFYRNPSEILENGRKSLGDDEHTIRIASVRPADPPKAKSAASTISRNPSTKNHNHPSSSKPVGSAGPASKRNVARSTPLLRQTNLDKHFQKQPNTGADTPSRSPAQSSIHTPKSKIVQSIATDSPEVIPSNVVRRTARSPSPTVTAKPGLASSASSMGSLETQMERTGLVIFANRSANGLGPPYRHNQASVPQKFAVEVITPTAEEAAEYLLNRSEFKIVGLKSRTTASNGRVHYSIQYGDGHTREVKPSEVLDYVSATELEEFENKCFANNENMETDYYLKHEGGVSTGGTMALLDRKSSASKYIVELTNSGRRKTHSLLMPRWDDSDPDDDSYKPSGGALGPVKRRRRRRGPGRPPTIQFTAFSDSDLDASGFDTSPYVSDSMLGAEKSSAGRPKSEARSNTYLTTDGVLKKKRGRPFGALNTNRTEAKTRKSGYSSADGNPVQGKKRGPGRPPGFTPKRQRKRSESPIKQYEMIAEMPLEDPIPEPMPDVLDEQPIAPAEEEYDVEAILDSIVQNGITYYHVKWVGYDDPVDYTWEPADRLDNATEVIEEFERRKRLKESRPKSKAFQQVPMTQMT